MRILFSMVLFALFLGGCAHHRDVRAGADGVHRVLVQTDNSEEGARDAIRQANHFCKQRNLQAAFVKEQQAYTGDMDEKTYKNAKRATTVAKTVGGTVYALGGRKESNLGGIVGLGGIAGDAALGKAYSVDMQFKCM